MWELICPLDYRPDIKEYAEWCDAQPYILLHITYKLRTVSVFAARRRFNTSPSLPDGVG